MGPNRVKQQSTARIFFFGGVLIAASGLISPAAALAIGIGYGVGLSHFWQCSTRHVSRVLLQASVVALGFGMEFRQIIHTGRTAFVYTAVSIAAVMMVGLMLGKLIGVGATPAYLISAGTAICGGSAIAALSPITNATEEETAVSLGTIFVLNAIALLAFPPFGRALHLNQVQFGLWSALAIHDTSSVVAATAKYGSQSLAVGTTVKLVRTLWIVPLSLFTAIVKKARARVHWPWFIVLFCLAAGASSHLPKIAPVLSAVVTVLICHPG